MDAIIHPDHDQLVNVVRDWFHRPFQAMGYSAEKRRWGTYWNNGHIYTLGFPPDQVGEFLADVCKYYGNRSVFINVDNRDVDSQLGPALCEAGCSKGKADIFLAYVGPTPQFPVIQGIVAQPVDESNLLEFAATRLRAFAETEEQPDEDKVRDEMDWRRAELGGTGCGMLAHIHGEPAGVIWWYKDPKDIWINLLGTRVPFRRQGVGRWLLCRCLEDSYAQGCRSVMLNVATDNVKAIRLYRCLGFRDEIYWRRRYLPR